MKTVFDSEVYAEARANRLRNLFAHVDPASLSGKRVFEVGCGTGELGEEFLSRGAQIVSTDARLEHIEELLRRFPTRKAFTLDVEVLQTYDIGRFDILLCWGLLYHLRSPARFLVQFCSISPVIYLETQVTDSNQQICPFVREIGPDQAFRKTGCRPSPAWIESVLNELDYQIQDISGPLANWPGAVFDWTPRNDGQSVRDGNMLRKMYICRRKV